MDNTPNIFRDSNKSPFPVKPPVKMKARLFPDKRRNSTDIE